MTSVHAETWIQDAEEGKPAKTTGPQDSVHIKNLFGNTNGSVFAKKKKLFKFLFFNDFRYFNILILKKYFLIKNYAIRNTYCDAMLFDNSICRCSPAKDLKLADRIFFREKCPTYYLYFHMMFENEVEIIF